MKVLETRPDRNDRWNGSVQVKLFGIWRTARKKFSVCSCQCGGSEFEFVLVEDEDWAGLEAEALEERFHPIPWWGVKPGDVLRHCLACHRFQSTNYAYDPPPGGGYAFNGWPARLGFADV